MKKNIILPLYLLVFQVLFFSCSEKERVVDTKGTTWRVEKLKEEGDLSWQKAPGKYILTFVSESLYTLKLDVNICEGEYRVFSGGNIYLSASGCTKVCCDSHFASLFRDLLPSMKEYYVKDSKLYLEGEGQIVLGKGEL